MRTMSAPSRQSASSGSALIASIGLGGGMDSRSSERPSTWKGEGFAPVADGVVDGVADGDATRKVGEADAVA